MPRPPWPTGGSESARGDLALIKDLIKAIKAQKERFGVERIAARTTIVAWCLLAAMAVTGAVVPGYVFGNHGSTHGQRLSASASPVRLVVPSLRIKAPLVPIEVTPEGALDPPRNYHEVGWWKQSAKPGASRGQTVMTGHTVHTGGGVMDDLGKIKHGARIKVVTRKGTMLYSADRVKVYTRAALAKHAYYLFNQKRKPVRLVLITCTGWTGVDYTSNVVVFASRTGVNLDHKARPGGSQQDTKGDSAQASAPVGSALGPNS